jgi:DNA-binding CsgD family transcriptional regulator
MDGPFLVIDETFHILNANARALDVLGCSADQPDFGRFVLGETPAQSLAMRKRIQGVLLGGGRAVLILRHPRHEHLVCNIKAIRMRHSPRNWGLVALIPPHDSGAETAPYLRDVFKLSKAEAGIALAAAGGADVAQIALDRNVSIHTLRTQIASIKAKMGCTRMTEVAVVVANMSVTATLI